MNNKEFEVKLKNAVEKSTPDVWERVQSDISHGRGEVITMSGEKKKSKVLGFVSGIAAACFLIFMVVFGITNYHRADLKAVSTVYLEVNPQIELSLNTYDVVLEATPKNEDGKKVLGNMELKDTQIDLALNAIFGSMVKNGYISETSNSVLLSVKNEDIQKAGDLQRVIANDMKNFAISKDFDVATVVNVFSDNKFLLKEAEENKISVAKAAFVEEVWLKILSKNNKNYSFKELANLSINELNLLLQSSGLGKSSNSNPVIYKGTASEKKYIGSQKAKEIALKAAKVSEKEAKDFEVELDFEKGKMVYEVEFEAGGRDFDFEIDAVNGNIIASQRGENKPQTGLNSSNPSSTSSSANTSLNKIDAVIAPENALGFALMHAGVESKDIRDFDVEIDLDNPKKYHYDVEFEYGGYEYDYEIDALTGDVIKSEKELAD